MKIIRDRKGEKKITLTQTEAECLRRSASLLDDIANNMPHAMFTADDCVPANAAECCERISDLFGPKEKPFDNQRELPLDPPEPISESTPGVLDAKPDEPEQKVESAPVENGGVRKPYIDPMRAKRSAAAKQNPF